MATLLCTVAAFGVSSAIDWTWFVPGTAVPALLCAGWLAGRGPLSRRAATAGARAPLGNRPGAILAIAAGAAVTLFCVWAMWQPVRSDNADAAAIASLSAGNAGAAVAQAREAIARDPLAAAPHYELSAIYSSLGNRPAAHAQLVDAIRLQPQNPDAWLRLGLFDLQQHQLRRARSVLRKALSLSPGSPEVEAALARAR